jgi:hypothetical protein
VGRYFRRGKSRILFSLDALDPAAPTRAELTDAVDLSVDIADIAGFELSNSPIPTPNLADVFTPQIEGEDTVADSTLTIYDRDDAEVIRAALGKGTSGYIFLLPYGDVPTERMETWEVKVLGTNDVWTVGNEAARFVTGFAITAVPEQNAVVPAAA